MRIWCRLHKWNIGPIGGFIFFLYWLYCYISLSNDSYRFDTYLLQTRPDVWKHPFGYILEPSHTNDTSVSLIILVTTRPNSTSRRDVIRRTWAEEFRRDPSVRVVFLTGLWSSTPINNTDSLWTALHNEADEHDDLVLAHFQDTYFNLSLKTYLAFRYGLKRYPRAEFFLKTDDDAVLFSENILKYLRNQSDKSQSDKTFFGFVYHSTVKRRNKKFYVPYRIYPKRYFPRFCSGHAYIGTRNALRAVIQYTETKLNYYLHVEDVLFTGLLAEQCNVTRKHSSNWHPLSSSLYSYDNALSIHHLETNQNMMKQWNRYVKAKMITDQRKAAARSKSLTAL